MMLELYILMGLVTLIVNAFQDWRSGFIDSRFNWLMYGATIVVLAGSYPFYTSVVNFLSLLIPAALMGYGLMHFKVITDGDYEAFLWIIPGLGLVSSIETVFFMWYLILLYCVAYMFLIVGHIAKGSKKSSFKIPLYPILAAAFAAAVLTA